MGNYVSCALYKTSSSPLTKVILPDGGVRDIHVPTKAAELMMEMPSYFLVDTKSVKVGRKFIPLAADDDLDLGGCHVYVAFPMTRATSAANASDMARLYLTGKKRTKSCDNRRVSPENEDNDDVRLIGPKLNLEDIEEFSAAEFIHRISVSKSKKPQLETIAEEHVP
ncbi:hypothetical protein AtNW77_Chr3g0157801 [Arabidopsis thaliana]|uniref:DUF4228 domain protein n=3 Tax=Arabidopsis TaxID=3701 RepID=A0A8T2F1C5_ARASU|nr:hypothetical protein ISN45_At03g002670 [Arabidopsis thaliana x Arabidopsis arenosa]KAG7629858.1 hypothetical protein ISN44_As03g002590 [Arabidopsis suecica]OAP02103.1 hypothetical protein AXX17_AT3G02620 [Arabidopsis thaliana]CAD5321935.1 unnamed protein product [Arabidopsis thaliana]